MTKLACFTATVLATLAFTPVRGADAPPPVVIESAPEPDQSKIQQENADLRAANQRLSGELHDVKWALAEAKTRVDELTAAAKPVEVVKPANEPDAAQLAAEKARADEAIARLNTLVAGLETLTAEKAALEQRLASTAKSEASAREELDAARKAATSSETATKLADTEAKLAEANRRITNLQADNQLLNTTNADHARLSAEVQTLRQEKAVLEAKVAQAQPVAGSPAAGDAAELSSKLAQTEAKLATALRSYSQLQSEMEKVKAAAITHSQQSAELEAMRQEKAALEAKLAQAQPATQTSANGEAAELSSKLAQTEDKLSTALRSYSQLQTEMDQLKSTAASQSQQAAEVEALRQEKAALEARIAANPTDQSHAMATRLADVEDKLATTLRSYSLLQRENDQLKAEAAKSTEAAQSASLKSANDSAAQTSSLFDELRQTQARATSLAAENAQLKTRLALVGSPPGSTLASPSRPGSAQAIAATTAAPATDVPASAQPTAPAGRTHVVVLGDTLGKLSRQYYGTPNRWEDILRANRDVVKNENALTVGMTLRIP